MILKCDTGCDVKKMFVHVFFPRNSFWTDLNENFSTLCKPHSVSSKCLHRFWCEIIVCERYISVKEKLFKRKYFIHSYAYIWICKRCSCFYLLDQKDHLFLISLGQSTSKSGHYQMSIRCNVVCHPKGFCLKQMFFVGFLGWYCGVKWWLKT